MVRKSSAVDGKDRTLGMSVDSVESPCKARMFSSMVDGAIPLQPLPVPRAWTTRILLVVPGVMVRNGTMEVSVLKRERSRDGFNKKFKMSAVALSCSSLLSLAYSLAIGVVAVGMSPFQMVYVEAPSSGSDADMIVCAVYYKINKINNQTIVVY